MIRFTSLLVTVLMLTGAVTHGKAQSSGLPHEDVTPGTNPSFALFDDAFYANQLFLLGESHGVQKPQELDFELLRHLNARTGLRYYVAEVDPTKAYYLNQYLLTGQDTTLMKVFRSWIAQTAQWANADFVRKIGRIRALNQTLPEGRRIRFIGIDAVQDEPLVAEQLRELTTGARLTPTARPLLDSLTRLLHGKRNRTVDSLRAALAGAWLTDLRANENAYRKALGVNAGELEATLTNLTYRHAIRQREPTLFANFRDAVARLNLQSEKLYGFWGLFHVWQAPLADGRRPFAALVRASELPMRDKIVSITCAYADCFSMVPTQYLPPFWQESGKRYSRIDKFNDNGELMYNEAMDVLLPPSRPNALTMFRLAGTAAGARPVRIRYAPFMPKEQQVAFMPDRPTTDYFQYVVLVRNSDMTEPLTP